jgi:2-C-methyl-D-erythritol 4-phosphate cytidylyltransferase
MGKLGVVVVAGGKGSRMRSIESKQYLQLSDRPILIHTLELFQYIQEVDEIVLVVGESDIDRNHTYLQKYELTKVAKVVPGGLTRQESVYAGLQALSSEVEWVMIHDGVRPFVTANQIRTCWRKAIECQAAILAVPSKETIKIVNERGFVESTPDRERLWTVQTPQAFRLDLIRKAHQSAQATKFVGTDDAMLVEKLGVEVTVVEGDYYNIKITTPEDLAWAEWILQHVRGVKQL